MISSQRRVTSLALRVLSTVGDRPSCEEARLSVGESDIVTPWRTLTTPLSRCGDGVLAARTRVIASMESNGYGQVSLKPPPLQLPGGAMESLWPTKPISMHMKDAKLLMRGLVAWKTVVVERKREQGMRKRARRYCLSHTHFGSGLQFVH